MTTTGEVNRAAVLHGTGDLRIEERAVPEPGPHEVLVAVQSVGVCGSDVHYYDHGRIGEYVVDTPMVLGHEASGVVVAVGTAATRHAVGTRVALEPGVPDMTCLQCRSGRYNLCPAVRFFATPPYDGAFATYVAINEDFAFAVPDSMSFDAAALIEPLSVGLWACRKGRLAAGETVLVTGAGPVGLCAVQAAVALGAGEVIVVDVNEHRLATASSLGATRVLDVSKTPLGESGISADVLLECSGAPSAVREGIESLRPAGRAVLVGMGGDEASIPMSALQGREVEVTGTFRYVNTYPTAIALVASGKIDLDVLVTGHFGLDDTEEALLASRKDPHAIKSMVTPAASSPTS